LKDEIYEFTKKYDYSVDVPDFDEDTGEYIEDAINISGVLTFSGYAYWSDLDNGYTYDFSWADSNNAFSQDGNAPDKEDEFIEDFRSYILQQGVLEKYLW